MPLQALRKWRECTPFWQVVNCSCPAGEFIRQIAEGKHFCIVLSIQYMYLKLNSMEVNSHYSQTEGNKISA